MEPAGLTRGRLVPLDETATMNVKIQTARVEKAAAILTLQKLAYRSEGELYQDWSIPPLVQTQDEMCAEFGRMTFLKALGDGEIVGSVRAGVNWPKPERGSWKCRAGTPNPASCPEMRRPSAMPPYNLLGCAFSFEAPVYCMVPAKTRSIENAGLHLDGGPPSLGPWTPPSPARCFRSSSFPSRR